MTAIGKPAALCRRWRRSSLSATDTGSLHHAGPARTMGPRPGRDLAPGHGGRAACRPLRRGPTVAQGAQPGSDDRVHRSAARCPADQPKLSYPLASCLCRRHHRLKTHARGWRFTMTADGVLSVTTPSGVTRTTRPPGLRLPADLLLNEVGGAPPDPDDDPPPF